MNKGKAFMPKTVFLTKEPQYDNPDNAAVRLVWVTPDAEKLIGYIARVSNPKNQNNPKVSRLLKYMLREKHVSPFEMANMCIEINTSMAIGEQILRHRSFSFQKFSGRYSEFQDYVPSNARRQDKKNRQNSINDLPLFKRTFFNFAQGLVWKVAYTNYRIALRMGISKENARFLLPANTRTRMYMNGTLRSWLHYIEIRTKDDVQLEHRVLALEIKKIFVEQFPQIAEALEWQ